MLLLFLMHSFLVKRNTMLSSWESEKHGIICVGKDLWKSVSLTSCLGQAYIRLLRSLTSLAMIISDYEDSQPLDTLLQCLTTLVVQKVLPYSQSGFPRPNLCPLSLTFQIQEESNQIAEEAEILSFILLFFYSFSQTNLFLTTSLCTSVLQPLMLMAFHRPHCRRFFLHYGVQDQGQYPRCGLKSAKRQSFLLTSQLHLLIHPRIHLILSADASLIACKLCPRFASLFISHRQSQTTGEMITLNFVCTDEKLQAEFGMGWNEKKSIL